MAIYNFGHDMYLDLSLSDEAIYALAQKRFAEFTSYTNPGYMYKDKLIWIDQMTEALHNAYSHERVNELIKDTFGYSLDEYGEIMDKSEFYDNDFMEACYEAGQKDAWLNSTFGNDANADRIMEIESIIIKAVMEYEKEGGDDKQHAAP